MPLGRHLDGSRIGFDLGASDRKCAAVVEGRVVFSEEVPWQPGTEADPQYHIDGIHDSLRRAAAHLGRVDAIGGSAAGVYVNNEVRVGSLYRSVPPSLFDSRIRRLFFDLQKAWRGVPFEVVNDGEVTALAGSMALEDNAVLGIAMGSSLAAGFVTPQGAITSWLNELAKDMPLPAKLDEVQRLMAAGDPRARSIYETIGVYFGYAIATFAGFYEFRNLLVLGRVMTGEGGEVILSTGGQVLREEFPELAERVRFHLPDETKRRHGQAIAAASLPAIHVQEKADAVS